MEQAKESLDTSSFKSYSPKIAPMPLSRGAGAIFLMVFGSPFIGIGVWILAMALEVIPASGKVNVPMPIFGLVGLIFFLCGLPVFLNGLKSYIAHLKLKPNQRRYSYEPWRWDYKWNPKKAPRSSNQGIGSNLFGLVLITFFSALFGYFMLTDKGFPLFFKVLMPAMFLLFYWIAIYNLLKALKFRGVQCDFGTFPFRLGESANFTIKGLPDPKDISELKVELRAIYSKVKTVKRGTKREIKRFYYETYKHSELVDQNKVSMGNLAQSIELPGDEGLSTDFVKDDFQFWELRVVAKVPSIDYDFAFLLPIYR